METYELYPASPDERALSAVADALKQGQLIIYPTDTHPALGCDALSAPATKELCRLKGINPDKQSLSIVCASLSQASQYARIDNRAFAIMRDNLPGPFTFILPASPTLPKPFKGRKQVGVRIPDNAIARAIAEAIDGPLLSGSIGTDDPMDYSHAVSAIIIDAMTDPDAEAQSSTIVDLTDSANPVILREGPKELV